MTDRPLDDFLQDILQEIERIERFMTDITTLQQFEKDEKTTYAVIRSLELIGEAVKKIPQSIKNAKSRNSLESDRRNARYSHTSLLGC